jgi:hypothetical protein
MSVKQNAFKWDCISPKHVIACFDNKYVIILLVYWMNAYVINHRVWKDTEQHKKMDKSYVYEVWSLHSGEDVNYGHLDYDTVWPCWWLQFQSNISSSLYPKDGSSMFPWNLGNHLQVYLQSQARKPQTTAAMYHCISFNKIPISYALLNIQ